MSAKTMAEVLARALYVAAHWQDTITEHDRDRKPQAEYERRAGDAWDCGNAGWSNYQRYPRYAEAGAAHLTAAGFGLVADAKAPEVRYVDLTTGEKDVLDEVVAFNATVHLEAMDSNHWWMAITSGGKTVHVNLYTKRAKITAHADEEDA